MSGEVAALRSFERTLSAVVLGGNASSSFDVTAPSFVSAEIDLDAFVARVVAAPHRQAFDAIVAGRCAWGLDVSLLVAGRLWSVARGLRLDEAESARLIALVKQEAELVDPDRFAAAGELRSLAALEATLRGDVGAVVRASISASLDEPNMKRWLSVLVSALERCGAADLDPAALDVLVCALRPRGAVESAPPARSIATTIGRSKVAFIETAAGRRARYRIEVDGSPRRVRARITHQDGSTNAEQTNGWVEGDDAELAKLVACLEQPDAERVESGGRLIVELDREQGSTSFTAERTKVIVDVPVTGPVIVDIHYRLRWGSF